MSSAVRNPADFPEAFAARFNRFDLDELVDGYEADSVLNLGGTKLFRGPDQIRTALPALMASKIPMTAVLRSWTASGDLAVVLFDWSIDGDGPDGKPAGMSGSAVDVLRRDRNGKWKQLLDMPFGNADPGAN